MPNQKPKLIELSYLNIDIHILHITIHLLDRHFIFWAYHLCSKLEILTDNICLDERIKAQITFPWLGHEIWCWALLVTEKLGHPHKGFDVQTH